MGSDTSRLYGQRSRTMVGSSGPLRKHSGARFRPWLPGDSGCDPANVHPDNSLFPYANCARGLESLLRDELLALGIPGVQTLGSGVRFDGGLESAYRVCVHSHIANRVLWPVHQGMADTPESLYSLVREVDWSQHLGQDGSLAVDFFSAQSAITHTQFGALKVKDAVVDQFREASGVRPDVDRNTPDVRLNVYVHRDKARLAIDLSGSSLHRRGYRTGGGPAPLKETLAAALLCAAGWPERAARGEPFADPMCGSGTLVIEAACMAASRAPGLGRDYFGFLRWRGHDAALWTRIEQDARAAIRPVVAPIRGSDQSSMAVKLAREGLAATGVEGDVAIEQRELSRGTEQISGSTGLLLSNPPWGERLQAGADTYRAIGQALSLQYAGWDCGVFAASRSPLAALGLPLKGCLDVVNGGVDCQLSIGRIPARRRAITGGQVSHGSDVGQIADSMEDRAPGITTPGIDIQAFVNRVGKNLSASRGWRKQQGIRAHRAYDADLPEFAVAIDCFDCGEEGLERHLVVQEYAPPRSVNSAVAAQRLDAIMHALPEVLQVEPQNVHLKTRERQRGTQQYQRHTEVRHDERDSASIVRYLHERDIVHELNFSDYLDVGVFLDHRRVRQHVRDVFAAKQGGHFLNLFAYTATASVAAAVGGADSSLSVDLSKRYCEWAQRNLALNGVSAERHLVQRADVLAWLDEPRRSADVILLDPPTHSNSTSMDRDWDVQTDHAATIDACVDSLTPDGVLMFSNNFRGFKLDPTLAERHDIEDRSKWSLSRDFKRNTRIHRCWFIKRRSA